MPTPTDRPLPQWTTCGRSRQASRLALASRAKRSSESAHAHECVPGEAMTNRTDRADGRFVRCHKSVDHIGSRTRGAMASTWKPSPLKPVRIGHFCPHSSHGMHRAEMSRDVVMRSCVGDPSAVGARRKVGAPEPTRIGQGNAFPNPFTHLDRSSTGPWEAASAGERSSDIGLTLGREAGPRLLAVSDRSGVGGSWRRSRSLSTRSVHSLTAANGLLL